MEEYFWQADMALQTNRLTDAYEFICQGIQQINQNELTAEQWQLISSIISKMIENSKYSIERLVNYHRSMPIETDELFDRLTKFYVNQLEEIQENMYKQLLDYLDRYFIQDNIQLKSELYLQLACVSRPYQSQLYYNKHRKLLNL